MATTTATRGIYAKTPERRAEILDAALEVFADAGFRSGSLREIADKAGMSQAATSLAAVSSTTCCRGENRSDQVVRPYF